MELAYLTSEYPARSHTFIRREIDMMREQGFNLHIFSLHRCAKSELLNEQEQQAYDETWSVFPIALKEFLVSHLACLTRSPGSYFRALRTGFNFSGGSVKGFIYTFFYFSEAMYLAEQLRGKGVGALHVHFANSGAKVGAIAAEYLKIPWIVSLHGNSDFGYPGITWLRNMARHASLVRCVSDYGASQVKRLISRAEYSKVFVSYCGLPSSYQDIQVKIDPRNDGPLKLLCVGRLSPEKGQILLIEAALKLKQQNVEFILDLVGDGPDRAMLEKETRELGLEGLVYFHGSVEEKDVFNYMRNADILICSSFMEGLPQVLMESMLVNSPVIAPYIAGIPELIENGKTGMLFPAGNVDTLLKAIVVLANDNHLYKEISYEGRQKVLNNFLMDQTIVPLANRVRSMLARQ